ncbi:MAG: hypothetical protein KME60_18215 [Cyanomargarita calcarea GSE-NOS-MK-12-04C]|jgi:hypothetical protein|uniref:Lipoprotein n=1 Tax=Cyanomargarita calcarea GSE-NOS-MK-12-04C TaxID=2839659 RepID=A0A951UU67_9CYAN|nr:hypothetical protein [Cyanomargarita calcarea GSE-NOS-MK-12-04C]
MKVLKTSLIALSSASLLFLGACSGGNQAANSESTTASSTTETAAKTETTAKDGEKHIEGDGHAHSKDGKDGHTGQVVQSGKYHLEFKPEIVKDSTHLDISVHGEQDKAVIDAKLTAQVQLPDGSNQTLQVPYNTEEKQYTAKLPVTATGDYKVVLQTDIKGEKFNGRFNFKR